MVSLVTYRGRESIEARWGSGARPPWAAAAPRVLQVRTVPTLGTGCGWEGPQGPLGAGDVLLDFSAARVAVSTVQNLVIHL